MKTLLFIYTLATFYSFVAQCDLAEKITLKSCAIAFMYAIVPIMNVSFCAMYYYIKMWEHLNQKTK